MIGSFIQMTSLILTLESSIFLLKSNLGITPSTISQISTTYIDYSKPVAKGFASQSADTRVGVILILSSFGICIVVLSVAQWYSKNLTERIFKERVEIIEKEAAEIEESKKEIKKE